MNVVHDFVHTSLPNYFRSIPIPKDISGFGDLTGPEILRLVAFFVLAAVIVYSFVRLIFGTGSSPQDTVVNLKVEKEKDKVATTVDIEDLGDQTVYCRCWRSSKFPICDGTHLKHDKETGDNVGPLILKRKPKEPESKEAQVD